jgi:hypothetical protein
MADKIRSKPYYAREEVMTLRQASIGFQALILAGAVQFLMGINVYAQSTSAVGKYTEFDVPGAVETNPTSIDLVGAITGSYSDATGNVGGFLRRPNGAITTFNVRGGTGTSPTSINVVGAITGSFTDAGGSGEGFVRSSNGAITTFNVPGSVFMAPQTISLSGEVAGYYFDANFVGHGFSRAPNGKLSTFDAPGAGASTTIFPQGTFALGISGSGTVAGTAYDAKMATFASFSFGKNLYINPQGVIAGAYFQPIEGNPFGGNYQVFIRARDGKITTFVAASPFAAYGRSRPELTWRTKSSGPTTTPIPSTMAS